MKQPDLYYFEAIKMTSQALLNFTEITRLRLVWLPQYKCVEIFQTLDSFNSSFYWYKSETCRLILKWGYLHCVKILSKKFVVLNF